MRSTQEQGFAGHRERSPVADILGQSFVAAHLLIGDSKQAERAVMQAIGLWNPDDGPEELFQLTLKTAALMPDPSGVGEQGPADYLPIELRHILMLPFELRRCFVLRVLVGLPSHVCAELLHVGVSRINQQSSAAMEYLSAIDAHGRTRSAG